MTYSEKLLRTRAFSALFRMEVTDHIVPEMVRNIDIARLRSLDNREIMKLRGVGSSTAEYILKMRKAILKELI